MHKTLLVWVVVGMFSSIAGAWASDLTLRSDDVMSQVAEMRERELTHALPPRVGPFKREPLKASDITKKLQVDLQNGVGVTMLHGWSLSAKGMQRLRLFKKF
jgi:hypothetical protein